MIELFRWIDSFPRTRPFRESAWFGLAGTMLTGTAHSITATEGCEHTGWLGNSPLGRSLMGNKCCINATTGRVCVCCTCFLELLKPTPQTALPRGDPLLVIVRGLDVTVTTCREAKHNGR